MKISNWTTNVANQTYKDLDLPGFTRFVAKIYQLRITRFWGKILNSNFCLCKKFDISQLCDLLIGLTIHTFQPWRQMLTNSNKTEIGFIPHNQRCNFGYVFVLWRPCCWSNFVQGGYVVFPESNKYWRRYQVLDTDVTLQPQWTFHHRPLERIAGPR